MTLLNRELYNNGTFRGEMPVAKMLHPWDINNVTLVHSSELISHTLFAHCHTVSKGVNFVTIVSFS